MLLSQNDSGFEPFSHKPVFVIEPADYTSMDEWDRFVVKIKNTSHEGLNIELDNTNKKLIFKNSLQEFLAIIPELSLSLNFSLDKLKRYGYKEGEIFYCSQKFGRRVMSIEKQFPSQKKIDAFDENSKEFLQGVTEINPPKFEENQ